ncbi:MAG: phage tail protein [Kofleriaceae bacterium]
MAVRYDPMLAFCFEISVNGVDGAKALFKSISGLKVETEVLDFKEGGVNDMTHKLVGQTKYGNLVLKRGFCGTELMQWKESFDAASSKGSQKKTITVKQLRPDGSVFVTWTFQKAWPVKWEMSEFDASKNEVSIETLEIAHHGFTRS